MTSGMPKPSTTQCTQWNGSLLRTTPRSREAAAVGVEAAERKELVEGAGAAQGEGAEDRATSQEEAAMLGAPVVVFTESKTSNANHG